eukprot:9832635-Karenia_brevis.AAC.1
MKEGTRAKAKAKVVVGTQAKERAGSTEESGGRKVGARVEELHLMLLRMSGASTTLVGDSCAAVHFLPGTL